MTERKAANGLDFAALRRAIEQSDPELLLAFYAEDASLSMSAPSPHVPCPLSCTEWRR